MSVKIVIDMNLSPNWVPVLQQHGWQAVHWSAVGDPRATDREIMDWARANSHIVFTHDLDFGTILALTHVTGPSVLQLRSVNVLPDSVASIVIVALTKYDAELAAGALVVVDESNQRARILPI